MTGIDYYRILGVPPSATTRAIREAYLDLVRRLHPDRVGPEGTARFQQVTEAYEHLSDPDKRRLYDRACSPTPTHRSLDMEDLGFGVSAEPLVPESPPSSYGLGDLFRFMAGSGSGSRGLQHSPTDVELEVTLTPTEASRGAVLPLVVSAVEDCPWCGGSGGIGYLCQGCGGRGRIGGEQALRIRIPAGIQDGTVLDVPLSRTGYGDRFLRLYISVQRHTAVW